jgi:hypothetical protein
VNALSVLAAFFAALRELFRLFAGTGERRRQRQATARDAKASAYDKLAKADRARQAVRDRLATSRAASRQGQGGTRPDNGGDAPAGASAGDGLPDDKYRRD